MSWKVGSYEGFHIFEPALECIAESQELVDSCIAANQSYLAGLSAEENLKPSAEITGSFIYSHAPDYVGSYTLNWSKSDWDSAFQRLKSKKIDTVILQASVWNELQEVYYQSEAFSEFQSWNVVEPMLISAKENGMTVFLGGYGSVSGWNLEMNEAEALHEIERQSQCFMELFRWRELFDGIYFSPETAFRGERDPRRERYLHWIYQTYFGKIKEIAPEKKIIMSPASTWIPGKMEEFSESWHVLLDGVPLDILAPQDSIGCCGCKLENMREMWSKWRDVTDRENIKLWANIELFERVEFGGAVPFKTASPERIRQQCRAVAPFAEKCVCWEALYFDLP